MENPPSSPDALTPALLPPFFSTQTSLGKRSLPSLTIKSRIFDKNSQSYPQQSLLHCMLESECLLLNPSTTSRKSELCPVLFIVVSPPLFWKINTQQILTDICSSATPGFSHTFLCSRITLQKCSQVSLTPTVPPLMHDLSDSPPFHSDMTL